MQIEKDINKLADLFESNLLDTNRGYNYYIDWSNIDGYKKYEIEIHNSLKNGLWIFLCKQSHVEQLSYLH